MKTAVGILLAVYLFLIVPFFAGAFWDTLAGVKKKRKVAAYVNGYVIMFSMFWCVAVLFLFRGCTLQRLSAVWLAATVFLCVVSAAVCRRELFLYKKKFLKVWNETDKIVKAAVAVSAVFIVISILFVEPQPGSTVQTAATAVDTNTTYMYQPYTGEQYPETQTERIFSPYEMLYAVAAQLSGLVPAFLIKIVLPFFLLPFFMGCYWEIGGFFFSESRKQAVFLMLAEAMHFVMVYTAVDTPVSGIFRSCWAGGVLLNCCIFPFAFLQLLRIMELFFGNKTHGTKEDGHRMVYAAGLLLAAYPAAQLLFHKGWFYLLFMTVMAALVVLVRKGYEYVSTVDRH